MEPQTRFCTTADGARIAYAVLGQGLPLVVTPNSWDSLRLRLENTTGGRFHQRLAQRRMLVCYDRRGVGLSDRERSDFTPEEDVRDLEAVVDSLGLSEFALLGMFHLGPAAIAYTARHPERITHLLLYGTYASGKDLTRDEVKESIITMVRSHWGIASRTLADMVAPGVPGDDLERVAQDERESASAETVARFLETAYAVDLADVLPNVSAPTLVMHRRGDRAVPFRLGRELSSLLPSARLVTLEGNVHFPWFGDSGSVVDAILEFLGEAVSQRDRGGEAGEGLRTILFTDIRDSTAMRQRLGDAQAQELLHTHNTIVRDALRAHGGSEIKHTGDGIMASFPSASGALQCAVAVQQAVAAHIEQHPEAPLSVYIGLNAGEPIAEDEDLFGTAVDLARRICDQAQGGEILASDVVRQLAAGKGFRFSDRGDVALRGFEEPVRLYEVRWRD